jgi:hypothetical protein
MRRRQVALVRDTSTASQITQSRLHRIGAIQHQQDVTRLDVSMENVTVMKVRYGTTRFAKKIDQENWRFVQDTDAAGVAGAQSIIDVLASSITQNGLPST